MLENEKMLSLQNLRTQAATLGNLNFGSSSRGESSRPATPTGALSAEDGSSSELGIDFSNFMSAPAALELGIARGASSRAIARH